MRDILLKCCFILGWRRRKAKPRSHRQTRLDMPTPTPSPGRLLVLYVLEEGGDPDEVAAQLTLSMISLRAAVRGGDDALRIAVACRPERTRELPQLGVSLREIAKRAGGDDRTVAASAFEGVRQFDLEDCFGMVCLAPNTVVSKDIVRVVVDLMRVGMGGRAAGTPALTVLTPRCPEDLSILGQLPFFAAPLAALFGRPSSAAVGKDSDADTDIDADIPASSERVFARWAQGISSVSPPTGIEITAALHVAKDSKHMGQLMLVAQTIARRQGGFDVSYSRSQYLGLADAFEARYYVILLSRRPERVALVERMRQLLPPDSLTVVEAVDGAAELDADALADLAESGFIRAPYEDEYVPGRPLLVNSVAACMSHRRALERVAQDLEAAEAARSASGRGRPLCGVVLEDDVVLSPESFEWVVRATAEACWGKGGGGGGGGGAATPVDIVQMYVMPSQRGFVRPTSFGAGKASDKEEYQVVPSPEGTWGMQCYMMRASGARKLHAGLSPMRGAVDEQLSRIPGLGHFALVGDPILEEDNVGAPSVTQGVLPASKQRCVGAVLAKTQP